MAGFEWRYNIGGGPPLIKSFYMKDTETLTKGDLLNLETGEVDLAATSDTALVGVMLGAEDPTKEGNSAGVKTPGKVAGTDSTTIILAIINPDAVYSTADANARQPGALLDISGATGAQTLAESGNTEFVVVERKLQTADPTYVKIIETIHYLTKSQ